MTNEKVETIHKTEYIDKELPRITQTKQIMTSTCEGKYEYISVSDISSEKALETFSKIKDKYSMKEKDEEEK